MTNNQHEIKDKDIVHVSTPCDELHYDVQSLAEDDLDLSAVFEESDEVALLPHKFAHAAVPYEGNFNSKSSFPILFKSVRRAFSMLKAALFIALNIVSIWQSVL